MRRALVEAQLRQAFPERDAAWVRRTARAMYAHLGREMLALLRLETMPVEEVRARTRVVGLDMLFDALAEGKGVILATGHLGNWEVAGAALALREVPLDVVVQRQRNPYVNRRIAAVRERIGFNLIDRRHAPRQALRALRDGRVVAFAADQNAGRAGVFVPFFGRLASTHRGPALMALRTGAPVVCLACIRQPDGIYEVTLTRLESDRSGDPEEAVIRLTAAFTAALELAIRRAPEQYFWLHRRWRTRPREEPRGTNPVL